MPLSNLETHVTGVLLKGHRIIQGSDPENADARLNMRTKGQLPEPKVISSRMHLANEPPFRFCSKRRAVAFRMEQSSSNDLVWDTLDFSLSACLVTRILRTRACSGSSAAEDGENHVSAVPAFRRTKPLLKRIVTNADLGGIQHLKRLSLRGCTHLQAAHVPASLEALDASSCSSLVRLIFPERQEGRLEAMNLRGCRSLVAQDRSRLFGPASSDILRYIKDLDLSSTKRLDPSILADAIRMTCHLESISLRYVASNAVIRALAESESARSTLRFVDLSFSENLGDEACEELLNAAVFLERMNLRACRSVSAALYNSVPVRLQSRLHATLAAKSKTDANLTSLSNASAVLTATRRQHSHSLTGSSSTNHSRRKGDVIFYEPPW